MTADDSRQRWQVYTLMIAVAAAILLARVARVRSPDTRSPTPFLSANDRSRWATIRALVDHGTYAIDDLIFDAQGNQIRGWHTIDLVRHAGPDGREHYYSSKPTLLPTLLAGEYWLLQKLTGASLAVEPHYVARWMLALTNVAPLALGLAMLAWLIERYGRTDWGRYLALAAAAFGTFLPTFAITLNNHLVAAVSLIVALFLIAQIAEGGGSSWWRFAAAGLALAFCAANELPALALVAIATLALWWKWPWPTALAFIPAALVVAAGAIGTNILAHGDWRTPYAHRSYGPVVARLPDGLATSLNEGRAAPELIASLREQGIHVSEGAAIEQRVRGERWALWDQATRTRVALERTPEGGPAEILVRGWDNWYDYEGSYWLPHKLKGTDRGEPSRIVYAANVFVGHHGLFSLTPLWLLSAIGCVQLIRRGEGFLRSAAWLTAIVSLVVIAFYLSRPQIDRNYGGTTCCLRWLIWLSPLWIVMLLPAADWLSRTRAGRAVGLLCLAVSVFSAFYAADNPWSHPWIFNYWTEMGWIDY